MVVCSLFSVISYKFTSTCGPHLALDPAVLGAVALVALRELDELGAAPLALPLAVVLDHPDVRLLAVLEN